MERRAIRYNNNNSNNLFVTLRQALFSIKTRSFIRNEIIIIRFGRLRFVCYDNDTTTGETMTYIRSGRSRVQ